MTHLPWLLTKHKHSRLFANSCDVPNPWYWRAALDEWEKADRQVLRLFVSSWLNNIYYPWIYA